MVRQETIQVRTLDSIIDEHYPAGQNLFLKIDTQGYEKNVLDGGLKALDRVVGMRIEMSIVENYENEMLYLDMIPYINDLGFRLLHLENGWKNKWTKELYQVDGIFFRPERVIKEQT